MSLLAPANAVSQSALASLVPRDWTPEQTTALLEEFAAATTNPETAKKHRATIAEIQAAMKTETLT